MNRAISKAGLIVIIATLMISCARSITTYEAANGKAKCGRSIR